MKSNMIVRLGKVIERNMEQISIDDNQTYKQVTVRLWGKGVQLRNEVKGHEIKSAKRFIVEPKQFIISKIDARNGASGLIPDELNGAVITADFLSFNFNEELIIPEYLLWLSKTNWFIEQCIKASSGTTNRVRLNEKKFLGIEIPLPDIQMQREIIEKINGAVKIINEIEKEQNEEYLLFEELWRGVLQYAFQGRLIEQESNVESVSELFKRLKDEKEKLIKEQIIKKEKPLEHLTSEEVPYILPKHWVWARIGDVAIVTMGQSPKGESYNTDSLGVPLINGPVEFSNDGPFAGTLEIKYTTQPTKMCEKGDLLICVRGSSTGRTNIAGFDACIGRGVASIKPINDLIFKEYLHLFVHLSENLILKSGQGSTFPNISLDQLRSIPIPIAPLEEQMQISGKLSNLMLEIEVIKEQLQLQIKDIDVLRQTVFEEIFQF